MTLPLETPTVEPPATVGQDGWPNPEGEAGAGQPVLHFHVLGTPAPQGSKRAIVNRYTGRANIIESSKRVGPWREAVKAAANTAVAAREGTGDPFATLSGPLRVHVTFRLARPKGHYRTGRNAHLLRDTAPAHPTSKPDTDKLLRSTLDAMTDVGVYGDDAQIVHLSGTKTYADGGSLPGASVRVYRIEST